MEYFLNVASDIQLLSLRMGSFKHWSVFTENMSLLSNHLTQISSLFSQNTFRSRVLRNDKKYIENHFVLWHANLTLVSPKRQYCSNGDEVARANSRPDPRDGLGIAWVMHSASNHPRIIKVPAFSAACLGNSARRAAGPSHGETRHSAASSARHLNAGRAAQVLCEYNLSNIPHRIKYNLCSLTHVPPAMYTKNEEIKIRSFMPIG